MSPTQDGSLRVRRAAIRVLSGAAVRADSPLEGRVLHTVALKCRDRSASRLSLSLAAKKGLVLQCCHVHDRTV